MAGLITHMVIAREMIKRLPKESIREEGLFYLGNLAPDAVHAREGYIRAYKKHTHFRDDIPDMEFEREEHQVVYRKRLEEFAVKNRERGDGLEDLYLGYVTHILTDELFIVTVRKEFCKVMEQMGISQDDHRFFEYIVRDMTRNDLLLVKYYEEMEIIRRCMEQVGIYQIEGLLSSQELKNSKEWLVSYHFTEEHEFLDPVYISYNRTLEFIQEAVRTITDKLTGKDSPLRML
jgi:hypothetical protein